MFIGSWLFNDGISDSNSYMVFTNDGFETGAEKWPSLFQATIPAAWNN
jgi:hypothetical protein